MAFRGRRRTRRSRRPIRRRPVRRRPIRRRVPRRRSRRTLLNITSQKKRDTLVPTHYLSSSWSLGGITIEGGSGNGTQPFLFCPTARPLSITDNKAQNSRTSTTPYYRGYAETVRISTVTDKPWTWRRVVFASNAIKHASDSVRNWYDAAPYGITRAIHPLVGTNVIPYIQGECFQGTVSVDFVDYTSGMLNRDRIRVISDRTVTLFSGNASGIQRVFKNWYPLSRTMIYDDREDGDVKTSNPYSVAASKATLADVYVLDFFKPASNATSSDKLYFEPQGCIYWHER